MLNTISKTPVSFLQELCLKKNIIPEYHVIEQGTSSHLPSFIYKVTCDNYVTQGQGRSKKEAKHAAAEKMLQTLRKDPQFNFKSDINQVPIPDDTTIPSPYEHKLNIDAVGPLTEFCGDYMLPQPNYQEVREEGPAHARMFTHRCFVELFGVEATDRQKKQAKQKVALQMLTRLKSTVEPRVVPLIKDGQEEVSKDVTCGKDLQETLAKFPNCHTPASNKYQPEDLIHPIMTDFTRYEKYKETIALALDEYTDLETPEQTLDSILQKIDVTYGLRAVDSVDEKVFMLVLNINFIPNLNLCEFGSTYPEAARKATVRALDFFKILASSPTTYSSDEVIEDIESQPCI